MSNKIFQELTKEKIELFTNAFTGAKELFWDEKQSKLIHPGEFGTYREDIVKDFISLFVPRKYAIESGFIINANGGISTQCDLVIYDAQSTPSMQSLQNQKFFPVETVLAVGEVKSDIQSRSSLSTALQKLAWVKKMREEVKESLCIKREREGNYDPLNYPFDQVFTFLICQKLDFSLEYMNNAPFNLYQLETIARHKHNVILSINDGALIYHNGESNYYYPATGNKIETEKLIKPSNENISAHFVHFISALVMGIKFTTILSPDVAMYLSDNIYYGKA